eukprot:366238-Chlamydomonas_euryale.AAC.20
MLTRAGPPTLLSWHCNPPPSYLGTAFPFFLGAVPPHPPTSTPANPVNLCLHASIQLSAHPFKD